MRWVIPWVARKDRRARNSPPIIDVKRFNGGGEIIFNKLLEENKG